MIVVDTNVIAPLYLTSDRSAQAEKALLRDFQWCAPLLWRSEMRNVLTSYLRKNILNLAEAGQIMEEAERLLQGREYEIASHHVLSLTAASNCSAYDCEFVALANDLETHLITTDKEILNQFPHVALSLEEFVS
jgi:predicted nucleic acid-binding protein